MKPTVPATMTETRRATANPGPCARNQWSPFEAVTGRTSAPGFLRLGSDSAVIDAVREIEDDPDRQPHAQPQPVRPPQSVNHRTADEDTEHRDYRQCRHGEAANEFRPPDPHDPDAGADEHEREQCADAGHFADDAFWKERGEQGGEYEEQHVRL